MLELMKKRKERRERRRTTSILQLTIRKVGKLSGECNDLCTALIGWEREWERKNGDGEEVKNKEIKNV